jgi:Ca2+-binding RTX toxin-like protein
MYAVANVRYGNISGNPANVQPTPTYVGHVWITIHDENGDVIDNAGFDPADGGLYGGLPGVIDADSGGSDWTSDHIPVTPSEYQKFKDFKESTETNPPTYSPFGGDGANSYNCTTWTRKAFDVMGVPLGDSTINFLPIRFSESFLPPALGGDPFTGMPWPGVDPTTNTATTAALNWTPPRRDPLVLDLDGNGITTSGINPASPILFDQDGDGIKTGTGWIAAGEAIVVRDLNGNGTIDSGRELFGDNTIMQNGLRAGYIAANGFQALADLDFDAGGNADGKFDASDTSFSSVKLWKDLNQDGLSQSNELFTFADLGIESINVKGTASNVNLGGGNTQTFSGSFTRTDGLTGDSGTAQLAGSLLLANNNFYREFTDNPPLTAAARNLPQMRGAGSVRDLREAMSLGTANASDLQAAVTQFAGTTTREGQRGQLDNLITKWADTIGTPDGLFRTISSSSAGDSVTMVLPSGITVAQYSNLINVLESFNGNRFYGTSAGGPRPTGFAMQSSTDPNTGSVTYSYTINPSVEQVALLQKAYEALKESVYSALVVQTRLQPYFDSIGLVIDETGVRFDTAAVVAMAQNKAVADPLNAVADLIDLQKYAGNTVRAVGWQPYRTLAGILETSAVTPDIQNLLTAERIVSLGATDTNFSAATAAGWSVLGNSIGNTLTGGSGNDRLYGMGGNDNLNGGGGTNILDGGDGDDVLYGEGYSTNTLLGGAGNDTLSVNWGTSNNVFEGGTGNDVMTGSYYGDTYRFNLGDGQDTINENYSYGGADKIVFGAGIAASDISALRSGNHLVFRNTTNTDQVTVSNWFADGVYQVETVEFADGTVWNAAALTAAALVVTGTEGADVMVGSPMADIMSGLGGNDTMTGGEGNDRLYGMGGNDNLNGGGGTNILDGGDGDDVLYGEGYSTNTLLGGAGNDTLSVNWGTSNNVFEGGTGNDVVTGSYYGDTYRFNLGDGQDTINENYSYGGADKIVFADVSSDQIWLRQVANNLEVSVIGTSDAVTINNWYSGSYYHVEQFKTSDGKTLLDSQVQNLVQAMSSFAPPAAGETTLPANYASNLSPTIAANWH